MPISTTKKRNRSASTLLQTAALMVSLPIHVNLACGQDAHPALNKHAVLEHEGNHLIKLSVTGGWPIEQIVTRLRREYGWAVDLERAPERSSLLRKGEDGKSSPVLRSVVLELPDPAGPTQEEERRSLEALARGLSENGEPVQAVQNGGDRRYDLIPKTDGLPPILSTIVKLPVKTRTVADTVSDIIEQVRSSTGQPIVEAGIVDSGLSQVQLSLGGELPARTLLAQALDALPYVKVWGLNFDPHEQTYVFALDTAVQESISPSGMIAVTPIRTSKNK